MYKGFKPFQTITFFFYSVRANKQTYNRTNTANKGGGGDYIYLSVNYAFRVDFCITQINMTSASFFCFTF